MTDQPTLKQAQIALEKKEREDPLKHVYRPHDFQEKIHRSRKDIVLCLGGNRTGKSYCAVAEALYYCLGRRAYAEVPEPPNTVWYVLPTSSTYEDAIKPILDQIMPWNEIASQNKRYRRFRFNNGSTLVFRTADQRQSRMTGASVDLVVVDEPISKVVFEELQARTISTQGRALLVLTPVAENQNKWTWIRDDIYIPWKAGDRKDIEVVHMPVADPDTGEPLVPHMTRKDIERIERQYPDPQTRAVRMYGEFITRSGKVFTTYDPEVHLVEPFMVPPNWHEWLVCDPQYHRFGVLKFAADEKGNYYVTDEYFSTDEQFAPRAERIMAMVGSRDKEVPMYVDYANPQDITELNYHFDRIGADVGAMPLPMQKRVEKMILRTHSMLEPQEDRKYHERTGLGGVYGAPRLLFFNDLRSTWEDGGRRITRSRLLWEMERLTWGSKGKPDKDTAGGGDLTDCLIYGCSIMASGADAQKSEKWKEGMSHKDLKIHEAIRRQDRIQKRGPQFLR